MVYCSVSCADMTFDNVDNVSPGILKKMIDVNRCVFKVSEFMLFLKNGIFNPSPITTKHSKINVLQQVEQIIGKHTARIR